MSTAKVVSGARVDMPADHMAISSNIVGPVAAGSARHLALCTPDQMLGLTVQRPALGVSVVAVDGELDALTTSLLEACLREQIAAVPAHLIVDLQRVRFLGASGLDCLLQARELAEQTTSTQLHLTGLITRVVARPLQITGLLERFNTYPTLTEALVALTEVKINIEQVDLLSVTGRLDDTGLTQLRRKLQALVDTGTQYLVVDLGKVTSCDHRLFDALAWSHQPLAARHGWIRLVGVNSTVRNALDEATPSEALLIDQASDWWTSDLTG